MPWFVQPVKKKVVKKDNISHKYQGILLIFLWKNTKEATGNAFAFFSPLHSLPCINFFSMLHL